MLLALVLQINILVPNFYEIDASLERFSLQQPTLTEETITSSVWFKALGWVEYATCTMAVASAEYRADRSDWEPRLGATTRSLTFAGIAAGSNRGTKWLADRNSTGGVALRIGSLVGCGWVAGYNFNRGFFRE